MHALNTFLFGEDADIGREGVFKLVQEQFGKIKGVSFTENKKPFGLPSALRLNFPGGYFVDFSFIANDSVWQSVEYVTKVTGRKLPREGKVAELRTSFGPDPKLDFDHYTLYVYEFLVSIPGANVYDDNHKDFVQF